ncbi:MAG TPA: hypothetical protein VK147_00480 [Candidatus Didemnitutus sp.]|nr:hypothetical protein [Candidatus Didemnitutus sp.]
MSIDWTIWFHGAYVAFVFACLFFGALAYRQIVDNLEVRRLRLGEDRNSFVSAPGILTAFGAFLLTLMIGGYLYANATPTVWVYAFPLVLLVQNLQMVLRLLFQRTQAKTRGIVVRPVLRQGPIALPYEAIADVIITNERFWATVTVDSITSGPVSFRIFRFSVAALEQILRSNTAAPIHRSNDYQTRNNKPPTLA